ncbi:2-dehydro-3-deoxygalactonokinase [Rugamonas rubra]|uniref:2-dehydro-3-deoxygalactonokinase n=1 Tax=Rugamonas rubra TaxID=758825 RepID=A0A1I4JSG0_9BURK|nr:2-dehydro-3-deoxygalactonokinase [Rugamonas rubra]SFL69163.1 2-dehydro-3-deoxygalactonokinase [Rugamonas rubra]
MNHTLLGIDWGTSNRRAYLIDRQGNCLARHEDKQGMLAVRGRFGESLAGLLTALDIGADVPLLLSGMVGSAAGWQEVAYADCALPLERLPAHLAPLADPAWAGRGHIVPGYCYRADAGADAMADSAVDVMRGEETQLLGAVALGRRDGWLVLPGTHSKWVLLRDGAVASIATYMTGELYAMLAAGGTLAALMDGDSAEPHAFAAGLRQAGLGEPLSNSLFRVRARVVAGAMPQAQAAGFVSGLLIGAEFAAAASAAAGFGASSAAATGSASSKTAAPGVISATARHPARARIDVIGSPALAERYAVAAAHFGLECAVLDPHQVYCAALSRFLNQA